MTTGGHANAGPAAPREVLRLLHEQASLYGKLEVLSERQRSLVVESDVAPLLTLLADRRRLTDRLAGIADRLAPVRREWSVYRERFAPVQRREADRLLHEAGQRLRRVIERDERDAMVLSGRKESVARDLQATHSTTQAILAYRASIRSSGRLDCVD